MTKLKNLSDATLLVTGGTGSFGSTMVRNMLAKGIGQVNVFSRDEAKQDSMRHELSDSRVRFFLGDTRDSDSIRPAMLGVDYVFHAAALKQVPSSEFFPLEAVKTNVLGSANVINCATQLGVKSVVCLSTDKAVYPINAMGMSKALMEKVAISLARNDLGSSTNVAVTVTRYGNVMFSRGSVIPLFFKQARAGEPITITDPTMTRFLMSLEESVELVEFALYNGTAGDLFVKKAPATDIGTLARAVIDILNLPEDYPVEVLGFRHGEKLYESLLASEELAKAEDLGDFYKVPMDARNLDYSLYFEKGKPQSLENFSAYTSHSTRQLDIDAVKSVLLSNPWVRRELQL